MSGGPGRDFYVIGRLGSYFVPTLPMLDAQLRLLTIRLTEATTTASRARVQHDLDELLERRHTMTTQLARETA